MKDIVDFLSSLFVRGPGLSADLSFALKLFLALAVLLLFFLLIWLVPKWQVRRRLWLSDEKERAEQSL